MRIPKPLKGIVVFALIMGGFVGMWYGAAWLVFGVKWGKLLGFGLLFGGMRSIIAAYDIMWHRPPAFSKRPWERPWEQDNPYG